MTHGYRAGSKLNRFIVNYVSKWGGLGDNICRIPAIRYALKYHPQLFINYYVHTYFKEMAEYFLSDYVKANRLELRTINELSWVNSKKYPLVQCKPTDFSSLRIHLIDHALMTFVDEQVFDMDAKSYPKVELDDGSVVNSFGLDKNDYVVVTTAFTAAVRSWLPADVNGVIKWIKKQGLTPVFLGRAETECESDEKIRGYTAKGIQYYKGIDLRDKTSLWQAAQIMGRAKCVVGIDNGLIHLAACTGAPIVVGYTTVKPDHRMPIRDGVFGKDTYAVVPSEKLDCRFCQSRQNFVDHDWRLCLYKDYACLSSMQAQYFIKQMEKVIGK